MPDATDGSMLPEHEANPFIKPLGPPRGFWSNLVLFERRPAFAPAELNLAPHLRRYCALRLFRFNEPLERQAQLAERIDMIIRMGYEGRDPARGLHHAAILDSAERVEAGRFDLLSPRIGEPTAVGFALIGHPGMGKSRSVSIVLESLPRAVTPVTSYTMVQVPWLLVQCQSLPSRKGLCLSILEELGRRVGVDYITLLNAKRQTADWLVLQVQNKLVVHAVGLLVIDEIQNMSSSREGSEVVMNFLVLLVNTAGIPVMLVGTMGATDVIQRDFRGARRAAALGSPVWERLRPGEEWDTFFASMMSYQWTQERTEATPELSAIFLDECQGILSVAVTLKVLTEHLAIQIGEVRRQPELITPALVRKVAADEFTLIRPMLDALRRGTSAALIPYPDLQHFQDHIDSVVGRSIRGLPTDACQARTSPAPTPARAPDDPAAPLLVALAQRGIEDDVAERIVADARAKAPNGDAFVLLAAAQEVMAGVDRLAPRQRKRKVAITAPADPLDLRSILANARTESADDGWEYRALAAAGVIGPVASILNP